MAGCQRARKGYDGYSGLVSKVSREDRNVHEGAEVTSRIDTPLALWNRESRRRVEPLDDKGASEPRPGLHYLHVLVEHLDVGGNRRLLGADRRMVVILSGGTNAGACAKAGVLADLAPRKGRVTPLRGVQSKQLIDPWLGGFLGPEVGQGGR